MCSLEWFSRSVLLLIFLERERLSLGISGLLFFAQGDALTAIFCFEFAIAEQFHLRLLLCRPVISFCSSHFLSSLDLEKILAFGRSINSCFMTCYLMQTRYRIFSCGVTWLVLIKLQLYYSFL